MQLLAAVYDRFGPPEVLRVADVPLPEPGPGEVRVRVHAAALNPKDVLSRKGRMSRFSGRRFPMFQGYDLAGVVDALGPEVTSWSEGDEVFGMIQAWRAGACAEHVLVPAGQIAPKPPSLDWEEAASVPLAGLTALQALRDKLALGAGDRVCINGASGGVGTLAVQVATLLGGRVTAVCSARNEDLVRRLGAVDVIDYAREDPLQRLGAFDAFFDVYGNRPWPAPKPTLIPGGRYCTTIPRGRAMAREVLARTGLHRARLVVVQSNRPDLERLGRWLEAGPLRPVIDHVFPLDGIAAANARVETRHARGKVVIRITPPDGSRRAPTPARSP